MKLPPAVPVPNMHSPSDAENLFSPAREPDRHPPSKAECRWSGAVVRLAQTLHWFLGDDKPRHSKTSAPRAPHFATHATQRHHLHRLSLLQSNSSSAETATADRSSQP